MPKAGFVILRQRQVTSHAILPTLTLKTDCDKDMLFLFSMWTDVNEANPPPFQAEFLEIVEFSMVMIESGAASIPPSYFIMEKVKTVHVKWIYGAKCVLILMDSSNNNVYLTIVY